MWYAAHTRIRSVTWKENFNFPEESLGRFFDPGSVRVENKPYSDHGKLGISRSEYIINWVEGVCTTNREIRGVSTFNKQCVHTGSVPRRRLFLFLARAPDKVVNGLKVKSFLTVIVPGHRPFDHRPASRSGKLLSLSLSLGLTASGSFRPPSNDFLVGRYIILYRYRVEPDRKRAHTLRIVYTVISFYRKRRVISAEQKLRLP